MNAQNQNERNPSYCVRLNKDSLVFSSAHFITFGDNVCERLHGHNYGLEIEVHGPLEQNHYVVDFIALRDTAMQIVGTMDHHVLLPTTHPTISVEVGAEEVVARFESRRWVFPLEDCLLLDIPNTTAELLAGYIGNQLIQKLELGTTIPFSKLVVAVDENRGQWGIWTHDTGAHD